MLQKPDNSKSYRQARDNAVKLAKLCPQGCEELEDLQDAIAKAPVKTN